MATASAYRGSNTGWMMRRDRARAASQLVAS
jgi:hypothetical protein